MNSSLHILLIPDGNRRHARREHLRQLQVTDPGALQQILDRLGEHNAAEALRRLGEDPSSISETSARIDVFDRPEITAPESQLKASYRESAVVLEDMLRLALSDPNVVTLSIYGMQSENLKRPPEMVRSFLNVETDFAERWLEDAEIRSNCSFSLVGNTGLLKQRQNDPEIGTAITRFQRKLEQLESLCLGTRLRPPAGRGRNFPIYHADCRECGRRPDGLLGNHRA